MFSCRLKKGGCRFLLRPKRGGKKKKGNLREKQRKDLEGGGEKNPGPRRLPLNLPVAGDERSLSTWVRGGGKRKGEPRL